jgi:hypothetical protein
MAMSVATAELITVPRPLRRGKAGLARVLISLGLGGVVPTLPTACGELCLRRRSSVLEPTLSVLKLGVRTRPKCQSDEMAPAAASLVSGLALLTATIRLGSTRRRADGAARWCARRKLRLLRVIGAITADVTARIGDGPLLAGSGFRMCRRTDYVALLKRSNRCASRSRSGLSCGRLGKRISRSFSPFNASSIGPSD